MPRNRILLLCLTLAPLGLAAEPRALAVQVIDSQSNKPVADAMVMIDGGRTAEPSSFEMAQKNRQFQPGALVIPRGSEVNFPNLDSTQHHVYSFSPAKTFDLELFADQPDALVVFDKTGVVEVGCNIHDQMQGFIIVTESALTARTDDSGLATISLPSGFISAEELSVSIWHPRLANTNRTANFTVSSLAPDPPELTLDLEPESRQPGRLDGLQKRFRDL
jgi:plastocyanin